MNQLSRNDQRAILNLMCRGNGIADIADFTGHSTTTVRRHLELFGEALIASHDRLVRGIRPTRIEADELWSYVYAKREKNVSRAPRKRPAPLERGAFWTWVALDPDSKLMLSWHVGNRDEFTGLTFLADLYARVEGKVLITTDGLPFYKEGIRKIFGTTAKHVVVQKNIESWRNPETGERGTRVIEFTKKAQTRGRVNLELASTSLVERLNASIRNFSPRFTRQTYKFSKKLSNHIYAQAIFVMYYNFVRKHDGLKGDERHWTPAMKAGLTDRVWSYDDLLEEVGGYWQRKAMQPTLRVIQPPKYQPLAEGITSPLPYFVMYSPNKREAKIHKGSCASWRQGLGRKDGRIGPNRWYAFESQRAARRCAESLAPTQHSVCAMCVTGHYVKHHVRSK